MTKEEEKINKYLTKVMTGKTYEECPAFTDFLTWKGFGKLWEWATGQRWWYMFENSVLHDTKHCPNFRRHLISPHNFAKAVADFLQKKQNGIIRGFALGERCKQKLNAAGLSPAA